MSDKTLNNKTPERTPEIIENIVKQELDNENRVQKQYLSVLKKIEVITEEELKSLQKKPLPFGVKIPYLINKDFGIKIHTINNTFKFLSEMRGESASSEKEEKDYDSNLYEKFINERIHELEEYAKTVSSVLYDDFFSQKTSPITFITGYYNDIIKRLEENNPELEGRIGKNNEGSKEVRFFYELIKDVMIPEIMNTPSLNVYGEMKSYTSSLLEKTLSGIDDLIQNLTQQGELKIENLRKEEFLEAYKKIEMFNKSRPLLYKQLLVLVTLGESIKKSIEENQLSYNTGAYTQEEVSMNLNLITKTTMFNIFYKAIQEYISEVTRQHLKTLNSFPQE